MSEPLPIAEPPETTCAAETTSAVDPTAPVRVGPTFVVLSLATLLVQLVGLQLRDSIFSGGGWLTNVEYIAWSERLGLTLVLALFTLAAVGLWMLLWVFGLRWLFRARPARMLTAASVSWVLVVAFDLVLRHELASIFGNAFDLMQFSDGVGGFGAMLRNTWAWYGDRVVTSVLAILGCGLVAWGVLRVARRTRATWGRIGRLGLPALRNVTLASTAGSFCFLTVFAHTWPETREVLVDETLVGLPFGALVSWGTDFDGDGYSQFDNPADTAPFDDTQHPWAIDVPNDGIDQDLLLGDLQPQTLDPRVRNYIDQVSTTPGFVPTQRRSVMIVILESTRHDALETHIDGQAVMPRLQAEIEAGALSVPHAHATRGFTTTSLGNLFWGAFYDPGSSIFDDVRPHGWEVAAFSGYDLFVEGVEESAGLERREVVFDPRTDGSLEPPRDTSPARNVAANIESWLRKRDASRPFVSYVHLQDPHFPYDQDNPSEFGDGQMHSSEIEADNVDAVRRAYFDQVHQVDAAAGQILDALRSSGHGEHTTVIFVSDHGEALFDDGLHLGHGVRLDDIMTRCAMVVVNSPVDIPAVLSHLEIRGLMRQMLTRAPSSKAQIVNDDGQMVFHYLGGIGSPSQIAMTTAQHGRVLYNFEHNTIRSQSTGEAGPMESGAVSSALFAQGRELINGWAYLQVLNEGRRGWRVP